LPDKYQTLSVPSRIESHQQIDAIGPNLSLIVDTAESSVKTTAAVGVSHSA